MAGEMDPDKANFVSIWGKKGSGKSVLARLLWVTYPHDRLVIDPTTDFNPADTETLHDPIPARWPVAVNEERQSFRYVPDPGSPTYLDEMDRAVGMAFFHERTMLLVDEVHELTQANKTGPHTRRALNQGRHRKLTLIVCGPRPVNVDPLIHFQSDLVYVFDLPSKRDRETVANNIGWDVEEFHEAVLGLPQHGYLRYTADAGVLPEDRLVECAPLPAKVVQKVMRS